MVAFRPVHVLFLAVLAGVTVVAADARCAERESSAETASLGHAEKLLADARRGKLSDEQAARAAELLDHEDPFVIGIAEWAIALKVQLDNEGQQIKWPCEDPPPWFIRWSATDGDSLLACDYVRQAVSWNLHHDGRRLRESIEKIMRRANEAATEARRGDLSPEGGTILAKQLARLEAIRTSFSDLQEQSPHDLAAARRLWLAARHAARPIVLANPALNTDTLVFTKRFPGHSLANITGSQYPWAHKPGGGIFVQKGLSPGSAVRSVVGDQLGPGHVHGMDLWWDADRVVFAYARQPNWPPRYDTVHGHDSFQLRTDQEPTHLFEIQLDGTTLCQITSHPVWSDFEPTYTAKGDVVFASDRSGRSSECGRFNSDHTVINLYAVSRDGTNLRRLNDNKDIDRYPHCLDNGLIAYTRWEYQERHFFETHGIWVVKPDGTGADAVFNQHLRAPFGLRDTRSIPGSNKLVSIATGHHTLAYGPVVVVNANRGINTTESLRIVTPEVLPQEGPMAGQALSEGGVRDRGGVYQTPWALSERCFLVSYAYPKSADAKPSDQSERHAGGFALYLIDAQGNKELLHRDRIYSCCFPMPVAPRPRPPELPDGTARDEQTAVAFVSDIYRGTVGVSRGSIKYLRISQRVGWPLDDKIGGMRYIPGNAWEKHFGFWSWAPVRVLGEVPVEKDGSVHFKVPADTAVYFQALDENHMELYRMRSHVTFQPGETRGCVGCHESRTAAPHPHSQIPMALVHEPTAPKPPPWGAENLIGFERHVQPVLEQHCVKCHGATDPAGGIDLTATRGEDGFYQSFRTMFGQPPSGGGRPLVSVSDRFSGAGVSRPGQFGSHHSPLVTVLQTDDLHRREVRLDDDAWYTLVTWIDANAPYHDKFFNKRPVGGGPPRRDVILTLPSMHQARKSPES